MEAIESIMTRRSIRSYTGQDVSDETIRTISWRWGIPLRAGKREKWSMRRPGYTWKSGKP